MVLNGDLLATLVTQNVFTVLSSLPCQLYLHIDHVYCLQCPGSLFNFLCLLLCDCCFNSLCLLTFGPCLSCSGCELCFDDSSSEVNLLLCCTEMSNINGIYSCMLTLFFVLFVLFGCCFVGLCWIRLCVFLCIKPFLFEDL